MQTCKVTWKVCSVQIALWWTRQRMSSGRFWTDLFCLAAAGRPDHPTIEAPSRERKAGPNWPRRGEQYSVSSLMPLVCLSSHGFVVNEIEMVESAVALVDALVDGLANDCSQVGFIVCL